MGFYHHWLPWLQGFRAVSIIVVNGVTGLFSSGEQGYLGFRISGEQSFLGFFLTTTGEGSYVAFC